MPLTVHSLHLRVPKLPPKLLTMERYPSPECLVLRLSEQTRRNVTHVCFFEDVVLAIVLVDADKLKGLDHAVDVETHVNEAVDEFLVVAVVSL